MLLKVLAAVFLLSGFMTVFLARTLVTRFGLDRNAKCDFENEMGEDELKQYKFNKTVVNMKMLGMLIALPGVVLIVVVFR